MSRRKTSRKIRTSPVRRKRKHKYLNGVCPYFTMFPVTFPLKVLKRERRSEITVVDPFCGRGTTLFAARSYGFDAFGFDSNPTAVAIAQAKLVNTSVREILAAFDKLMESSQNGRRPNGEFWQRAYHPATLATLVHLRLALAKRCASAASKALRALLIGALHGPIRKGPPAYFSNQMPRTFAPKPNYAVKFWKRRKLKAPHVDVRDVVKRHAQRFFGDKLPKGRGKVSLADSRQLKALQIVMKDNKADWVITSPPYYGLASYRTDHWLRLWFLGGKSTPLYSSKGQLRHRSPKTFANDLRKVWNNLAEVCKPGARLVIRFGSINQRSADPRDIIRDSLNNTKWKVLTVRSAGSAADGKRQARSFLTTTIPKPEFDVWATLKS
jgi:DNA modification methylase